MENNNVIETNEERVQRILKIYDKLNRGQGIKKRELALEYNVSDRTIQRDIEDIRKFLDENKIDNKLVYDKAKKDYILSQNNRLTMTMQEIFALLKILLESRAFNKDEMQNMVNSILRSIPESEKSFLKKTIGNELFHFQPLQHGKPLLRSLWDIEDAIYHKQMISIRYKKVNDEQIDRVLQPISIFFSESYFYLVAYIDGWKCDKPAFFRLDRIKQFEVLDRRFRTTEQQRFEEGELRKHIHFMHGGNVENICFSCKKVNLESILDRFPTAKIIETKEDKYIIKAKVMGDGCLMWLLSQNSMVEIIKPEKLRNKMTNIVQALNQIYLENAEEKSVE